jgi:hypothetical protein
MSAQDAIVRFLSEHPQFAAVSAILWALGQMAKGLAPLPSAGRFWRWYRKTLPWHPIFVGSVFGLAFPQLSLEGFGPGRAAASLFFAGSGVGAVFFHTFVYRPWTKH